MLPWSFSEEAAMVKYMPRLQHNMWVVAARSAVLSVITAAVNGSRSSFLSLFSSALRLRLTMAKKLRSFCKSNYTSRIRHESVGARSS
jgi:hypothetical protein